MPKKQDRLTEASLALITHAWRTYRTRDVLLYIEESLTVGQSPLVAEFLAWLEKNPDAKTGRDYLDETLEQFYASRSPKRRRAS